MSFSRALASWNTLRYVGLKVAPIVTPTAMSNFITGYAFPPILMLCLWVGLFFATWDGGEVFPAAAGSLIVALIALLPATFLCGLAWRYIELTGDAVRWIRYWRRYRRRP